MKMDTHSSLARQNLEIQSMALQGREPSKSNFRQTEAGNWIAAFQKMLKGLRQVDHVMTGISIGYAPLAARSYETLKDWDTDGILLMPYQPIDSLRLGRVILAILGAVPTWREVYY